MDLFHSISGMVEAELTAADIADSLMTISGAGVELLSVSRESDLTARILLSRRNYRKAKKLCERRGDTLRPVKRTGLFWKIKFAVHRPVLVAGIVIFLIFALLLPTKVLFVEVEGNTRVPSRRILEAAEACGVEFWASRRGIRSERVKNGLLERLPELQWAGVNTYGCVAVISVRERVQPEEINEEAVFGHVIALREGIVTECTATRGTLLCQPGQAVVPGQILISGYTDCGIKLQASGAAGEVFGRTVRPLDICMMANYEEKAENGQSKRVYSLLIGKKRIKLWKDSGICDTTCGRIYEENYITLPGGFQLPAGWAVDTWIYGTTRSGIYPEEVGTAMLESAGNGYIRQQMVAGRIDARKSLTVSDGNIYRLAGEYVCTEMIGKLQAEQIGETNGKSN